MERKQSAQRPQDGKPGRVGVPKVQLAEVAKAAGVSAATASHFFNNSIISSDPLYQKKEESAKRLGYRADGAAHMLASWRTPTLRVMASNRFHTDFSDVNEAFQQRLQPYDYTTPRIPLRAFDPVATDYALARINGREFIFANEWPLELVLRASTTLPHASRYKKRTNKHVFAYRTFTA